MRVVFCQEDVYDWTDELMDEQIEELIEYRSAKNERVVGGVDVDIWQYPYFAQVLGPRGVLGGGSIIAKRWIVTAAHLERANPVVAVLVGSGERGTGYRYEVDMIKHEAYIGKEGGWKHDIALLRLQTPLQFNQNIKNIRMAGRTSRADRASVVEVIGFGKTESGRTSRTLKMARLRMMNSAVCAKHAEPGFSPKGQYCAENFRERRDSCSGDSGGPLITRKTPTDHVLVGVVSYGPKNCTEFETPGFYTRISSYVDWIHDKMRRYSRAPPRGGFFGYDTWRRRRGGILV